MRYVRMWYIIPHTKTKRSRTRVHACTRARVHTRRLFFWDVSIRNSLRSNNVVNSKMSHQEGRRAHGILYAILSFKSVSRRLDVDHYAKSVLKKPANGLEVHASFGGSLSGGGRRCQGRRYFREPVQGMQRIPPERAE